MRFLLLAAFFVSILPAASIVPSYSTSFATSTCQVSGRTYGPGDCVAITSDGAEVSADTMISVSGGMTSYIEVGAEAQADPIIRTYVPSYASAFASTQSVFQSDGVQRLGNLTIQGECYGAFKITDGTHTLACPVGYLSETMPFYLGVPFVVDASASVASHSLYLSSSVEFSFTLDDANGICVESTLMPTPEPSTCAFLGLATLLGFAVQRLKFSLAKSQPR